MEFDKNEQFLLATESLELLIKKAKTGDLLSQEELIIVNRLRLGCLPSPFRDAPENEWRGTEAGQRHIAPVIHEMKPDQLLRFVSRITGVASGLKQYYQGNKKTIRIEVEERDKALVSRAHKQPERKKRKKLTASEKAIKGFVKMGMSEAKAKALYASMQAPATAE